MTFAAIDFIKKNISCKDIVFEYGTGGSTIFFAQRAGEVISVDHDEDWMQQVVSKLNTRKINNVNIKCFQPRKLTVNISPDASDYNSCTTNTTTELSFQEYVNSINEYSTNFFDWVVVEQNIKR